MPVSVRVLRMHHSRDEKNLGEKYQREIDAWQCLHHPSIPKLLGTVTNFGLYQSHGIVSPWMDNGNLSIFLTKDGASSTLQERLQIVSDVIEGISYIHAQGLLHGNINGTNVLIDGSRRAYLIDFSLLAGLAEFEYSPTIDKSVRWRAAELLPAIDGGLCDFTPTLTQACDVYSFGAIMLQALSGRIPYYDIKSNAAVLVAIAQGILPHRPEGEMLNEVYWEVINTCWRKPDTRPSAEEVRLRIRKLCEAGGCGSIGPCSTL